MRYQSAVKHCLSDLAGTAVEEPAYRCQFLHRLALWVKIQGPCKPQLSICQ